MIHPSDTQQHRLAVSPAEAADLLGLSITTVRRLVAAGTLASIKVGRRVLIRVDDVRALLDQDDVL